MKLVQMQYSPDAFEHFLRNKLDEVRPDPTQKDQLWEQFEQMDQQKRSPGGNNWFLAFAVVLVAATYYFSGSNETVQPAQTSPAISVATPATPVTTLPGSEFQDKVEPAPTGQTTATEPPARTASVQLPQTEGSEVATENTQASPQLTNQNTIGIERAIASPPQVTITPDPSIVPSPVTTIDTATKSPGAIQKPNKKKGPVYIIW